VWLVKEKEKRKRMNRGKRGRVLRVLSPERGRKITCAPGKMAQHVRVCVPANIAKAEKRKKEKCKHTY
jgi:hypothetical protein